MMGIVCVDLFRNTIHIAGNACLWISRTGKGNDWCDVNNDGGHYGHHNVPCSGCMYRASQRVMKRQAVGGVANGGHDVANARKRGVRVTRNVIFLGDNTQPISCNFFVTTRSNSVSSGAGYGCHRPQTRRNITMMRFTPHCGACTRFFSGHTHDVCHVSLVG